MRSLPIYLTKHRKEWSLSMSELGFLLNVGRTAVSNYEGRTRLPSRDLLIAAEVVFGKSVRELFPEYYGYIEDRVMENAKLLDEQLSRRTGYRAKRKLELLRDMVRRAQAKYPEA